MNRQNILTMAQLKWIGIITMLIDHIGAILIEPVLIEQGVNFSGQLSQSPLFVLYIICRLIGRIAFPLFAFGVSEGILHTRCLPKYALRMGIFSLVSEPFFNLAVSGDIFYPSYQNVMATFFIAIVTIYLFQRLEKTTFGNWVALFIGLLTAYFLNTDYGWIGVLMVFCFWYYNNNNLLRNITSGLLMVPQATAIFSILLIEKYNDKKGTGNKLFFYVFYPLHLFILYLIATVI